MDTAQRCQKNICLSIAEPSLAGALAVAHRLEDRVDVIEIRLDLLDAPVVQPFVEGLKVPLLFTNRPQWEGGHWQGTEEERIALLTEAIACGAAYVDIELLAPAESRGQIIAAAALAQTKVIVSWHNFTETPADEVLVDIFNRQRQSGADIGKIVTMAHDHTDSLRVLGLQLLAAAENFPLAAFCMGQAGKISRAATLELGGILTYAAADRQSCTAPGQLSVDDLRTIQELVR
ncbi:MAG: type I 3-dehydroquinate dehydratase [Proteobacteria bacterium]|nr:type I 3-dehydroquinate dehydratase [Pseudomonadota bacterium]MBU1640958.1 type I 3-dehydroquinate dehydratase [Pseudomonadota bacterium]